MTDPYFVGTNTLSELKSAPPAAGRGRELLVIEPGSSSRRLWRDLWAYRELFAVLAWRDISVRYKQTAVGVLWALLKPFLTIMVFTVLFGRIAGLPTEGGAPYTLLVVAGLLPWNLFATSMGEASNSIVSNATLVSKVYFPRIIVPVATIVVGLADFVVTLVILAAMMVWYRYVPGWQILLMPVFVGLAALAALGPGLLFASLVVKYRDIRYVVPFVLQLGVYISPVGYSSTVAPASWRLLYSVNPLVGIIDGFRWCILDGQTPFEWQSFAISVAMVLVLLWLGLTHFRRNEKSFVDLI